MKLSFIVCGRFHYHHYVGFIKNHIEKVYYSYKFSEKLGLNANQRENLFLKEYFLGVHLRFFGRRFLNLPMVLYHRIWKTSLYLRLKASPINLVMLHGNCLQAIVWLKKNNCCVWGEAVNMHPISLRNVLRSEALALGLEVEKDDRQFEEKLLEIQFIDYLLCPSSQVRDTYISNGFRANRAFVLPYGSGSSTVRVEANLRLASKNIILYEDLKRSISVICVGQISIRKGQYRLIQALFNIINQGFNVSLTLVGKPDSDYLNCLLNTGFEFNLIEHLNHADVKLEMARHDVFALFSLEDGFGMVVTEAMEVGVPVVVSKYAGASEIVSEFGGGIVIDPLDVDAAATAILNCVSRNYPCIEKEPHSWLQYADALIELIECESISND